jgi:hypothetical protein
MRYLLKKILLLCLFLSLCSCAVNGSSIKPRRLSESRLVPVEYTTIDISLNKDEFIQILKEGGDNNKVRLVRIYHRGESTDSPGKYRLLDVKDDGIFAYMQLKENDLILAADDYIIPKPIVFWEYIKLIPSVGKASVEVERGGNNLLLNYVFVE